MVSSLWSTVGHPPVTITPSPPKMPKPFVHCSPTHGLVPDHAASTWEYLAQSYTKCNVNLLFKLWHYGLPHSESIKIHQTKQTVMPFMLSLHSLSIWMYMAHWISTYISTWYSEIRTHTRSVSFSGCWRSSWTLWLYHLYSYIHTQQCFITQFTERWLTHNVVGEHITYMSHQFANFSQFLYVPCKILFQQQPEGLYDHKEHIFSGHMFRHHLWGIYKVSA
jgi:hypothetical protein